MRRSAGPCRIELSPILAAYSERIAARPAYRPALDQNFPPEALAALRGDSLE